MRHFYRYVGFAIFGCALFATTPPTQAQVAIPWSDDFEAYASGTLLVGVNGWTGWHDNFAWVATTTTLIPPGSSVEIEGTDDQLAYFIPATTGQWVFRARQFIPSNMTGESWIIMLNEYDHNCSSCNWSAQVAFSGGTMTDTGVSGATLPYIVNRWVDIRIDIDLDANTQEFFYDGTSLYSGSWSEHVSGGGSTAIAALDLFANGATSVFYDDMSIVPRAELPVELISFDALAERDEVILTWSTASETNNAGFSVEQSVGLGAFNEIGYVEGYGTVDEPREYRFTVHSPDPGVHLFRLKQIDFDGAFEYSPVVEVATTVPDRFLIEPAYPNPFNPSTTLRFAVPVEQFVTATLVNVMGQPVRTLYDGIVAANEMQQLNVDASALPSGAYLVHFEGSKGVTATERIVLTK